ncbi:inositol polyphosphate multikinase [[Candida] railenensis]|uniref:Kinase n=1 Tax=[Candida] railenensis TaxID=45579 RepID=A0A9P0QNF4_9ASCO|nr:inositol polyphosphate multikinase [[Candida] railenensis]
MQRSFVPSTHQAAGHVGCLVSPDNGTVFAKLTNQQEIDFYTETQILDDDENVDNSPLGSHLGDWMPVYMGTLTQGEIMSSSLPDTSGLKQPLLPTLDQEVLPSPLAAPLPIPANADPNKKYIVLQNVYYGFSKPSILDIKLGKILYDDNAEPEKKTRLQKVADSTTSGSLGFRICGMKLYHSSIDHPSSLIDVPPIFSDISKTIKVVPEPATQSVYLEFNKFFGRSLNAENVKQGLLLFFKSTQLPMSFSAKLIEKFLVRLQAVYNCLLESKSRMIATSLLFVYENDVTKWERVVQDIDQYDEVDPLLRDDFFADSESDDEDEYSAPLSSLSLIDFAHSKYVEDVKTQSYDENVIEGILNLIGIFEELVEDLKNDGNLESKKADLKK